MSENRVYTIPKDTIDETLINLMHENEKIVVLSSDVAVSSNVDKICKQFPNRFFEMGIAEQSTMSVAGGMAIEGLIPVYVALAIFSCGMTFPQMRQVCNADLNVKIIGTHPGVDNGQDGSGHHATEDIALSRAIPRMTVLVPSDVNETVAAIQTMIKIKGPVYMRIARTALEVIHSTDCAFPIGKAEIIYDDGDDYAIVYEGSALNEALDGYRRLKDKGYKGKLVSIRTIKPLDRKCILELAQCVKGIITVENHSIIGGLYSSVAEVLVQNRVKATVVPVGFRDVFMESGSEKDIKRKYGVTGADILRVYEEQICEE